MIYHSLPEHLLEIAAAALEYFQKTIGIQKFDAEAEVLPDLKIRPTLVGKNEDYHHVCVEVTDEPLTKAHYQFFTVCIMHKHPVQFWIASPSPVDSKEKDFNDLKEEVRKIGVGFIEVMENGKVVEHFKAVSLQQISVRKIELSDFPPRYWEGLNKAQDLYSKGYEAEGLKRLYDELEALTRRIAKKIDLENMWKDGSAVELSKIHAWANLLETIKDKTDKSKMESSRPGLDYKAFQQACRRALAVKDARNEVSHKSESEKEIITRNKKLGTWFETATDVLEELIEASAPLQPD